MYASTHPAQGVTASEPHAPPRTLALLRATAIGLPLFIYTLLGPGRNFPPFRFCLQIGALLGFTAWWVWRWRRGRGLPRTPVSWPLMALLGSGVLSTVFSVDPRASLDGLLSLVALVLLFFLVCDVLLVGKWSAQTLVDGVLVFATLLLLQSVYVVAEWHREWYSIRVPSYPTWPVRFGRLYGVAFSPNLLAPALNLGLPFAIMRLVEARRPASRYFWGLWLAVADVILVLTGSRGGWLGTLAVVGVVAVWLAIRARVPKRGELRLWVYSNRRLWWALAAYGGLFLLTYSMYGRPIVSLQTSETSGYATAAGALSGGRLELWRIAWEEFRTRPLLGSGLATYVRAPLAAKSYLGPGMNILAHAHNQVLNLLAEQGAIGLLAFLSAIVTILGPVVRELRRRQRGSECHPTDPALVASLSALAGLGLHSQVDLPTTLPANAIVAVLIAAVALHSSGALAERASRGGSFAAWIGLAPCALVALFIRQHLAATAVLNAAEMWHVGDMLGATRQTDTAVEFDPKVAFYHAQRGYAYSALAEELVGEQRAAALEEALRGFGTAIELGPQWGATLLNAAYVRAQLEGPHTLEQSLSPWLRRWNRWPLPWVLLAEQQVAEGRVGEATATLAWVLELYPSVRETAMCRSSDTCRRVAGTLAPPNDDPVAQAHEAFQHLYERGSYAGALAALEHVPLSSPSPLPWLDRAQAHVALGQLAEARYCIRVAEERGADRSSVVLLNARVDLARGDTAAAVEALAARARLGHDLTVQMSAFHAQSAPVVPSLALGQCGPADLEAFRLLEDIYHRQGLFAEEASVRERADRLEALLHGVEPLLDFPPAVIASSRPTPSPLGAASQGHTRP